ncbi:cyclase family protein [Vibrio sp. PP-XX7]
MKPSPTRRIVDLSVTLDNNPYTDPPPLLPQIDYTDHQAGWPEMANMFPGLKKSDLPGDEAWAIEKLVMSAHNGTHMDAPGTMLRPRMAANPPMVSTNSF